MHTLVGILYEAIRWNKKLREGLPPRRTKYTLTISHRILFIYLNLCLNAFPMDFEIPTFFVRCTIFAAFPQLLILVVFETLVGSLFWEGGHAVDAELRNTHIHTPTF